MPESQQATSVLGRLHRSEYIWIVLGFSRTGCWMDLKAMINVHQRLCLSKSLNNRKLCIVNKIHAFSQHAANSADVWLFFLTFTVGIIFMCLWNKLSKSVCGPYAAQMNVKLSHCPYTSVTVLELCVQSKTINSNKKLTSCFYFCFLSFLLLFCFFFSSFPTQSFTISSHPLHLDLHWVFNVMLVSHCIIACMHVMLCNVYLC